MTAYPSGKVAIVIPRFSIPHNVTPKYDLSIRLRASPTDPIEFPFGSKLLVALKAGSLNTLGPP